MPNFFLNTSSNTARTLNGSESGFIGQNGSLAVSGTDAITTTASFTDVAIAGSVYGYGVFGASAIDANGDGIDISIADGAFVGAASATAIDIDQRSSYRITNDGTIFGTNGGIEVLNTDSNLGGTIVNNGSINGISGDHGTGSFNLTNTGEIAGAGAMLNVSGGFLDITNSGIINGGSYGLLLDGTSDINVWNSGTITGISTAAIRIDTASEIFGIDIVNTGTLQSRRDAVDINFDTDVRMTNSGTIVGQVRFSGGDDFYDGRMGTHQGGDPGDRGLIAAGNGANRILGGMSEEEFAGGSDSDFISGGGGGDLIDGNGGVDIAYYGFSTAGVFVNLTTGTGTGGEAAGDILRDIENLIGSGHDDVLAGNGAVNSLSGGNGNDALYGQGGNDKLDGGVGADVLNGGEGVDEVSYATSFDAVRVNLTSGSYAGGTASGDTLISIEAVSGSAFGDTMTGSLGTDRLYGGAGDDTIKAFRGNDFIRGDGGADNIFFIRGDGTDTFFDFQDNIDTITFQGLGTGNVATFISSNASAVDADGDGTIDDVRFDFGSDGTFNVLNTTIFALQDDVTLI